MTERGWPWLQSTTNYGLGTLRISWNGNRFTGEVDIGLVNSDGHLGITNGVSTTDDGALRRPRGVVGVGVAFTWREWEEKLHKPLLASATYFANNLFPQVDEFYNAQKVLQVSTTRSRVGVLER